LEPFLIQLRPVICVVKAVPEPVTVVPLVPIVPVPATSGKLVIALATVISSFSMFRICVTRSTGPVAPLSMLIVWPT